MRCHADRRTESRKDEWAMGLTERPLYMQRIYIITNAPQIGSMFKNCQQPLEKNLDETLININCHYFLKHNIYVSKPKNKLNRHAV